MIYDLIIAGILILSFILAITMFLKGVKVGKAMAENKIPQFSVNPVEILSNKVEEKKIEKIQAEITDEFNDIFSVTKDDMREAIRVKQNKGSVE